MPGRNRTCGGSCSSVKGGGTCGSVGEKAGSVGLLHTLRNTLHPIQTCGLNCLAIRLRKLIADVAQLLGNRVQHPVARRGRIRTPPTGSISDPRRAQIFMAIEKVIQPKLRSTGWAYRAILSVGVA